MSSSAISNNNKSDSIDFDFFEDDCLTKVYSKQKQSDSSKIITKAVIETRPELFEFPEGAIIDTYAVSQHFDGPSERRLSKYCKQLSDTLSSPSSSLDRKLLGLDDHALDNLMNCLAYNDESFDRFRELSSPNSFDPKESSDNSLTDSTVTTITSDFTCISPLSSSSLSSSSSSSCESIPDDDHVENSVSESNPTESKIPTELCTLEDLKQEQSRIRNEGLDEFKETDEPNSLQSNNCESEINGQELESEYENGNSPERYESDFESDNEIKNFAKNCESGETIEKNLEQTFSLSDKESRVSTLEDELGDISITQSRSSSVKTSYKKRKNCNLTFSREELIRIERDNLILLKKIMNHSKNKPSPLNQQPFCHKKTSTAINRAKLQKKIEHDNYILYSKISAMSRLKKVF